MTGGWRVRLKPGVVLHRREVEPQPRRSAAYPHPDDQWRMEDHALAAEVRIVTFDPWAVHPDSADPARRTSCETQDDAPLLATPAVSEATPDTFTAADRDPRHQHAPLDYLIDETGLGPPIAPVGSDELVDEEWEELERAEGDAIAGLIEAAPDEEELIGAIESLDVEETNDGAYFDEDEVGGVGEWDDTLDGPL